MTYEHPADLVFPDPAWTTPELGALLQELARGQHCVELGTHRGFTTLIIARSARTLVSVDDLSGANSSHERARELLLRDKVDRGWACEVDLVKEDALIWLAIHGCVGSQLGLVFLDAAHDYHSTFLGAVLSWLNLEVNGWLVVHDYEHGGYPEVAQAMNDFVDVVGATDLKVVGGALVIRRN